MKSEHKTEKWLRILLGLFLIIYALNQFLHFIPGSYGKMPENTRDFIDSVAAYLPALYIFEIIVGVFLLLNKWTPFVLIVLFPLTVAFLIFNFSNGDIKNMWPALIVAILNIYLMYFWRGKYRPLFD